MAERLSSSHTLLRVAAIGDVHVSRHSQGAFRTLFTQITSSADTSLVAVTTPVAKVVEIHTMTHEGGVMKMRAVDAIPVAAGKTVDLSPGGYHVMLMDLAQPLKEGEKVPLTLTFADKSGKKTTQDVSATVRALAAAPAQHKH